MSVPKIAAMLSLASALSPVSHGPAQSAPLTSLSAAAKPGTEQTNAVQVRWRRGWHNGAGAAWSTTATFSRTTLTAIVPTDGTGTAPISAAVALNKQREAVSLRSSDAGG